MTVRFLRHLGTLLAVLILGAGTLAFAPVVPDVPLVSGLLGTPAQPDAAPAAAPTGFAAASEATVLPGSQTFTETGQCTANFVFTDGRHLYLGQAAHCTGVGGATAAVNGCLTESLPLGADVDIAGAEHPGTLAYSSWLTMQQVGESDTNTCLFNDFALLKLHPDDHDKVNPSLPFFGGPNGVNTDGTATGEPVYSYGSSILRLGLTPLSPKTGVSLGTAADGWTHPVYTVTPGIPGDSGSGFLDSEGNAMGVLSTLTIAPLVGSNGVTDLNHALQYMRTHTELDAQLVPGTEPFRPLL